MKDLSTLPKQDVFKFIGIDHEDKEHFCTLAKKRGRWVMTSNTAHFVDLAGWRSYENCSE